MYARLLTTIDGLTGPVLLVDPYLPSRDLLALLELPGIKRVLARDTGTESETRPDRRRRLAIALGARPEVELRFSRDLHDRLAIPSDGGAVMIGSSLGGRKVTVATRLSDQITASLRSHYEEVWNHAEPLEPIQRSEQSVLE